MAKCGYTSAVVFKISCHFKHSWFPEVNTWGYCQRRDHNPLLLSLRLVLYWSSCVASLRRGLVQKAVLPWGSVALHSASISPLNTWNLQNTWRPVQMWSHSFVTLLRLYSRLETAGGAVGNHGPVALNRGTAGFPPQPAYQQVKPLRINGLILRSH